MPFSIVPDLVLERYTDVTAPLLERLGVRLLLCDLDYTLAPRRVERPDNTLRDWIGRCRDAGVTVVILSNNRSSKRVEMFCGDLGIRYVGHAGKPGTGGFLRAMEEAGEIPEHTAMVGDKLLTDMLGARRSGVLALMVEPLGGAATPWQKVLHALQAPFKALCRRREERRR